MTYEDLKTYVGAKDGSDAYVIACYEDATALVEAFIGTSVVPASAKDRAILETGSELFHRKNAPNGLAQFQGFDGAAPVRIARDPMVGAYPILSRWMVLGL
jgi:hypothetical protein